MKGARAQHVFRNWAGTHEARPSAYHQPRSEAELAAIIQAARAARETVRLVGAAHSWNDIACTSGHLVNLDRYAAVRAVDRDRRQVTVEAGVRLRDLVEHLDRAGLALSNLGSISEQSIAGAISTGTHGSGARFGNLATQVIALRLVDGRGRVHDVDRARAPDLFAAARVGLGCMGAISTVTLQCEPTFHLDERSFSLPFDRALADMQSLVDGAEHVKLWWLPHTRDVHVFASNRTARRRTRGAALTHWLDRSLLLRATLGSLLRVGSRVPRAIPLINRTVKRAYFRERRRVDRFDRVFNTPMPARHRESEYAVARASAPTALDELRRLVERERLHVNFLAELRFVAADDMWLSPAAGRATCQLGAYIHYAPSAERYFAGFETLMLAMDGRPHWGKEFCATHLALRSRYPEWDRFLALRRELDPDGVFVNPFVRRVLGV